MNHMELHKLEREIADVLEKGFMRPPNAKEQGFDRADCIQAAHDVAEMLADRYLINPLPLEDDGSRPLTVAEALEKTAKSFTEIAKDLSQWCGVTGEEKR